MTVFSCATCAVEYAEADTPPSSCPICEDERQYVPPTGQAWTTMKDLRSAGHTLTIEVKEPDLYALTADPKVGIGQTALLARTEHGNLLWDPTGYLDDESIARIRDLGGVAAIVASHPHMYGAQIEWSRAFDDAPVYVARADERWLGRPDPVVRLWSDEVEPVPGVRVLQVGGHFPGSAVALWHGADGNGVLLAGDTIMTVADIGWLTFMRSYPNLIPLSAATVERLVRTVEPLEYDRLYNNFGRAVERDAKAAVRRSADRYIGWVRGDFDADT